MSISGGRGRGENCNVESLSSSNERRQTLFSSQDSILEIKVVRLQTRFFDAPSRGKSSARLFSRELSSIFIPSKKRLQFAGGHVFQSLPRPIVRRRSSEGTSPTSASRGEVALTHGFPRGRMDGSRRRGGVAKAYLDMQESFSQRRRKANAAHRLRVPNRTSC